MLTQRRAVARGGNPLINTAVASRRPILLGLVALLVATSTYYGLLFSLAQYFQQGLGRGALASGLILVPWVVAFGLAGQVTGRLPVRLGPILPTVGYLLLTSAYLVISIAVLAGRPGDVLLAVLLAVGGLGLGTGFATLIGHLTNTVPRRYAADISAVSTTALLIGGAVGVAAFGSIYLELAARPGADEAGHAFAITSLALSATGLLATAAAYLITHLHADDASGHG